MIPKYRAWDKEGNRMILPKYLYSIDLLKERVTERTECNYTFSLYSIPFDKVELMQSTGLKDKNGKEIFEGDVIAIEVDDTGMPINAKVFQNSKIGVLMFHVFEDNEDVPMVELLEDHSVAFEIIGNIYENPELLEVEE